MLTIEQLKSNEKVIEEIVKKYRKELTEFQGDVIERIEVVSKKDYIDYMNSISEERFIGSLYTGLCIPETIDMYKDVLNGKVTIKELLESLNLF